MLSSRNYKERLRQMEQKNEHFSIRKLTVGAASVLIGISFLGFNAHTVSADTTDNGSQANEDVVKASDVNSDEGQASNEKTLKVAEPTEQKTETSAAASATSAAQELKVKETSAASSATELKVKSNASSASSSASSASVKLEAASSSAAKSEVASSASSATSSAASSAAKDDDNVITSNGNGVVTGKNAQGTWAAMDDSQGVKVAVTNWAEFANAWNNSTVTQIDLAGDINVDDSSNVTKKPNPVVAKHKLEFTGNSISRKVTVNGNGHAINFGDWYFENSWENKVGLIHTNGNRAMKTPWDVTFNDVTVNANNTNPFGFSGNTNNAPSGDAYDNTKYDKVTFNNVTATVKDGSLIDSANVNVQFTGDNKVTLQSIINKHAGIDANSVQVLNGTTIINAASPDKTGGGVIDGEGMNVILVTPHNAADFSDPKTAYDSLHVAEGSTLTINANTKDQDGNLINKEIPNQYDLRGIVTRGMGVANASDWTDGTLTIDGNLNETLGSGHSSAIMARNLTINKTGNVNILTQQDNEHDGFENSIVGASSVFNGFHAGVIALNVGGIQSSNIQAHDSSLIDNGTLKIVRKDVPATNKADGKVWAPLIVMGTYGTNPVKYTMNVGEGATLDLQDQASFVSPALYTGKVMTNTPFAGLINMYGVDSNDVLSFTKPAYVNLQRTGQQTGTLIRLEGNNDSKNAGNMIQLNGVTPGGTPLSQWDTGNYTDNPSNTWRIQNLTAHDAKGMNAILGYETVKGSKDNHTLKFLDSNGAVTLTMDKTGQVVYTRNGDGQVVNDPQGTVQQEVQLNNFLNNFNFWTPQRISFGNKAAISQSIYAPTDVEQGTTKTVKPTVFNTPANSPEQDQIKTTYAKTDDTPAWVSVDENTGELTLAPTADNSKVGMYNVPVLVTDTDQTNSGETTTRTVFAPVFVTDGNETVVWPKDPEGNLNGAIVITTDPSALKAHETSDNNMDLKATDAVKSIDEYQMDTVNTISTTPTSIAKDSKGITISWGNEPSTVVSEATKGETIKGTVNVTFDKDSQPFADQVVVDGDNYKTTSDLNIDAPGAVAQETAPATKVAATAGTQLTDDQFKALVNNSVPASEINHATLQSVDKDNAVVRITFNDKDAQGNPTYLDVKVPASYVTTPSSDADKYNPHYNPVNVNQGGKVETGEPTYGEGVTAPEGTKYEISGNPTYPEGVTATIDPNTGNVTVTTSDNTPEGPVFVPVTVTYPDDGSQETIDAPIAVGSNTFIGTDYSVTVETGLDNLHETTENSMAPNAKDVITKITWWNNNDVRAGKNLAGNVIYDKANGTGNLDDVTVEWTNPINTNVAKATMGGTLAGTDTVTVNEKNPAIKITYGANSKLIKDTGNGLFTTQGGSQTAQWYGKVTVQGADAKNPAKPVDVTTGVNGLTSDQVAALINTTNLDKLTANKPVSYTWATPLKKGDTQGTVKITFSDKAANGQATYLNVELPAGSINVTDGTVIDPTNPNDPDQKDMFKTVTRTIDGTTPDGKKISNQPEEVIFARTKTVNKKTGEVMGYGEYKVWDGTKQTDKTTGSFTKVDVPQVDSYTSYVDGKAAKEVPAVNDVTPETKSSTIKVTYTAKSKTPDTDTTQPNGGNITVDKGHKLTDGDAEDAITNHTKLPEGTKYTWKYAPDTDTVGDKNGVVTVTYPAGKDGKTPAPQEVPVMVHVIDDADKYDPQGSTITIKKGDPVPNAEQGIKNPSELPTGTKYTWDVAPDPDKVGNQPVIVNVTYPDGSIDKVPTTVIVTDNNNGNPTTPTDADKYDPEGKVVNVNKGDKLPDASNGISNTSDLPEGTNYTWKTPVDTTTSGNKPAIVVVTYPDGSQDNVPTVVHVNPTDADKYTPEGQNITVDKGDKVPDPSSAITNKGDLPDGTKYSWNGTPDTNTIGDHPAIVVVTYPDGSQDKVPVIITVKDPNNKPANPTDADNNDPEGGTIIATIGQDLSNDAPEGIVNKGDLPDGTKYEWTDGTPTTTESGLTLHDITVTYPDGSKEIVPAYVNVVSDADKYTPAPQVVDTNKGQVPDPSEGIGNKGDLPGGTKYTWKDTPDVNTIGDHPAVVIVTYPDGSQDEVPTIVHVTEPSTPDTPATPVTPVTPSTPTDADTYTPIGQDITTPEGEVPDASQGIANKDQLPGGTTYTWQDSGKVADDVKKPGSHSEIIVVTYPDGSTDTVTVNVNVEPKSDDDSDKVPSDNTKTTKTKKHAKHKKHSNTTDTAGIHSGNVNGENTSGVHSAGIGNGNGNHSSFYGNTGAKSEMDAKTLPQTGAQDNSLYGLIGLAFASLSAIIVLAGDKKRKN